MTASDLYYKALLHIDAVGEELSFYSVKHNDNCVAFVDNTSGAAQTFYQYTDLSERADYEKYDKLLEAYDYTWLPDAYWNAVTNMGDSMISTDHKVRVTRSRECPDYVVDILEDNSGITYYLHVLSTRKTYYTRDTLDKLLLVLGDAVAINSKAGKNAAKLRMLLRLWMLENEKGVAKLHDVYLTCGLGKSVVIHFKDHTVVQKGSDLSNPEVQKVFKDLEDFKKYNSRKIVVAKLTDVMLNSGNAAILPIQKSGDGIIYRYLSDAHNFFVCLLRR